MESESLQRKAEPLTSAQDATETPDPATVRDNKQKKPRRRHNALRTIAFLLLMVLAFDIAGRYISIFAVDGLVFWRTTDFYLEDRNSLDAVVLGSSSTYSFWDATYAWNQYGITAYPYSTPQQPLASTCYVLEECRKTQPDAVYLINLNLALVTDVETAMIHFLSDVMPPSLNRIRMIEYLCDKGGFEGIANKLEYYYPIFAMHERWRLCHLPEKGKSGKNCKGGSVDSTFLKNVEDVSGGFYFTDVRSEIPEGTREELDHIFSYLEENNIQAAFFMSPAPTSEPVMEMINSVCDYVSDAGYTVYNGFEHFDEIGLDVRTDFCDNSHTNISGARKFTRWLSQQIIADFGLPDHRGEEAYLSWDEAYEHYEWVVRTKQMSG